MTIIEVSTNDLEHLLDGAQKFGRCGLVLTNSDGDPIYLAATANQERKKPGRRPRASKPAEVPPPASAPAAD